MRAIGVHPVDADEPVHLIELHIDGMPRLWTGPRLRNRVTTQTLPIGKRPTTSSQCPAHRTIGASFFTTSTCRGHCKRILVH